MSKGTRLIKRALALFLVLLLSIESFGAIVSDNDGSAFITKAEFDSLKNNFQAQIDQYNTSIDNKIDGAIAAYLTGLKVMKASQYPLVFQDENVHFMNQAISPQYRVPALYLTLTWTGRSLSASNNIKQFGIALRTHYPGDWSSNETQKKPLVKLCTDVSNNSESNIQKIYWDGCALRYREKFTIGKSTEMNYSDLANFDRSNSKRLDIYYAYYIRGQGYNSSMNTASIISTSAYPYYYENGWKSAGSTSSYSWDYNVSSMNVSLDAYNNKIKDHLHVITYNNPTWEVYNEQFLNTVSQSSNTVIYESTIMNKVNNTTYTSNTGVFIGSAVGQYYANGVEQNFFQTTSRQGTLEWTATTSGPLYVKCIPHYIFHMYYYKRMV